MSKSRTNRLKRIRSIEEQKLGVVTVELKKVNQTLDRCRELFSRLQAQFEASLSNSFDADSISELNQFGAWTTVAQSTFAGLKDEIKEVESEQRELLAQVARQRATVKGWNILIEKLESEQSAAMERDSLYTADDRFLSRNQVMNRRAR